MIESIDEDHDDEGEVNAVCLLRRVPGRCPLVGNNPSSPRLTTFCFAEKVLLPCLKYPGRVGGRCWSVLEDIQESSPHLDTEKGSAMVLR